MGPYSSSPLDRDSIRIKVPYISTPIVPHIPIRCIDPDLHASASGSYFSYPIDLVSMRVVVLGISTRTDRHFIDSVAGCRPRPMAIGPSYTKKNREIAKLFRLLDKWWVTGSGWSWSS
jgi:hypothetical protein